MLFCKKDNQIVIINDNASIHKDQCVMDIVNENKINFFFTVPYSPQTNLPVENYFGRMKQACIFDHFIFHFNEKDLSSTQGFDINENETTEQSNLLGSAYGSENLDKSEKKSEKNPTINGTSYQYITTQSLIERWDYFNMVKYDSEASMRIFYAWETVLNDCKSGKELTGDHYKIKSQGTGRIQCNCYRKN